jgi:hypothetical protein
LVTVYSADHLPLLYTADHISILYNYPLFHPPYATLRPDHVPLLYAHLPFDR